MAKISGVRHESVAIRHRNDDDDDDFVANRADGRNGASTATTPWTRPTSVSSPKRPPLRQSMARPQQRAQYPQ